MPAKPNSVWHPPYYRTGKFEDSILQLERFLRTNQDAKIRNSLIAYANYMLGLNNANYSQSSIFGRFNTSIRPELDTDKVEKAVKHFTVVIEKYPLSDYAQSARNYILIIRKILAENLIVIAEHYKKRQLWIGVVNRCQENLDRFPGDTSNRAAPLTYSRRLGKT